jgi:D-glycero-D-manno-heptose 1,7-bisphosphate phosphatase
VTRIKQAVLLVGGRGTRLGSLTANVPKPLLQLAPGLRFLDVILDQFARHGFTDLLLLAGHLGDQVEAIYQGRSVHDASVRVIREPEPAGTAGALTFAAHLLDDWFLMANGDSFLDINLRALAQGPLDGLDGRLALRV